MFLLVLYLVENLVHSVFSAALEEGLCILENQKIFFQCGDKDTIHMNFLKSRLLNPSSLGSTQYLISNSSFSEVFSQSGEMAVSHSQVISKGRDSAT